jgi:hypothetical protein
MMEKAIKPMNSAYTCSSSWSQGSAKQATVDMSFNELILYNQDCDLLFIV